jgi:hypothetical protein
MDEFLLSQTLSWPMFHGNVNNSDPKLFASNIQRPIFATRFERNAFTAADKREVL